MVKGSELCKDNGSNKQRENLMRTIEAKELEAHTKEVLRQVEEGETIEVMEEGKPVARMIPILEVAPDQRGKKGWTNLEPFVEELSKYLSERVDAVEAVREIRREL